MSTETTVVVEHVGPARKRLRITIPASVVDAGLKDAYSSARAEAQVPGFRRGTAPIALIEKRFGAAIVEDLRRKLLSEAYGKALHDHKLQPISDPEVDEKAGDPEVRRGTPLAVTLDVEIVPDITLPALEDVEVRRPVTDIPEKLVDAEVRALGYRFGTPGRIDGPFQPLDRMVGRAVVRVKGAAKDPYFEADECMVVVPDAEDAGKGQVLGLMFDDLGPKLGGRKVGDAIALSTKGPAAHEREELRNADITVEFTPSQAERIEPSTPESVATTLGLGSIENLRQQVRMTLESRRDQEQRSAMREQAAEWLEGKVSFELPEKMSGAQVARNLEMARMQFLSQGLESEQVEHRLAEIRGASEADTRRRLKVFFILAKLAQDLGIEVGEGEVNGQVAQMARSRGMRPDQMRAELQQSGRLNELALSIREAKVLDRVLSKAKVTDIKAEEWNALVAERQKAAAKAAGRAS
jgi:trigger factor